MMKHDLIGVRGSAFGVALAFATISSSVLAADLGASAPAAYTKAPAYEPVSNWTGLYIGGNVGYGWGNNDTAFTFLPTAAIFGHANATVDPQSKGVIGGAQAGYNWQVGTFVAGLEADIQGAGLKGSATIDSAFDTGVPSGTAVDHAEQNVTWFGTVRGRLGVTVTPSLLLYGTGGFAYGHVDTNASFHNISGSILLPVSVSNTKTGWTAGAGAEWMFTRGWSAKMEYLHVDLGTDAMTKFFTSSTVNGIHFSWKTQEEIVRFGVNYHFN